MSESIQPVMPNICDTPPKVTALICTLNEELNLPHVLPRIPAIVSELLIVDGHSTDATVEVARRLFPGARIVQQPGKGKGDALRYGIQEASGDFVMTANAGNTANRDDPGKVPSG